MKLYYKIGDKFGVPNVEMQRESFKKAKEIVEKDNRQILNAGLGSRLDIFKKVDFSTVF